MVKRGEKEGNGREEREPGVWRTFEMEPPRPRAAVVIVVVAVFVWELVADFLLSLLSLVSSPFLSSSRYSCLTL